MNTENVTSPAPRDRLFALIYTAFGYAGILPAITYVAGWCHHLLRVLRHMPDDWLDTLMGFIFVVVMFIWGMALLAGYIKMSITPGRRRVSLWSATTAYNAILAFNFATTSPVKEYLDHLLDPTAPYAALSYGVRPIFVGAALLTASLSALSLIPLGYAILDAARRRRSPAPTPA